MGPRQPPARRPVGCEVSSYKFLSTSTLEPSGLVTIKNKRARVAAVFEKYHEPMTAGIVWSRSWREGEDLLMSTVKRHITVLQNKGVIAKVDMKSLPIRSRTEQRWIASSYLHLCRSLVHSRWRTLEWAPLRKSWRDQCVYCVYSGRDLIFIGVTGNLHWRLRCHMADARFTNATHLKYRWFGRSCDPQRDVMPRLAKRLIARLQPSMNVEWSL